MSHWETTNGFYVIGEIPVQINKLTLSDRNEDEKQKL